MSERWTFLIDPAWRPGNREDKPPFSAVVGGWFAGEGGEPGPFRANPGYEPSHPGLPTDPVDVALQRLAAGDGDGEGLLDALSGVLLGLAVGADGEPLVAPAPDGVPSVLVATAPLHRSTVDTQTWRELTIAELADALPPGTDVLLNPGGAASIRLTAEIVRSLEQTVPAPAGGFWEDDVFGN